MNVNHYIGFDVHKKSVSYCVKTADGRNRRGRQAASDARGAAPVGRETPGAVARCDGSDAVQRLDLRHVASRLRPQLQMGHPALMKAIGASKKKNDKLDARKIADMVRCDLLPACYVAPVEIRELRRMLRYRNLVVGAGGAHEEQDERAVDGGGRRVQQAAVAREAILHRIAGHRGGSAGIGERPAAVESRRAWRCSRRRSNSCWRGLRKDSLLAKRVMLLESIRGVGEVTALTWALEVGDPHRFSSVAHAVSYCGLTSALISSADKQQRGPISKQRNAHLQTVLIEAAKLAPRWNPQLAAVHARELERGNRNRATLAVARKLVAYLLAVDKSGQPFEVRSTPVAETEAQQVA